LPWNVVKRHREFCLNIRHIGVFGLAGRRYVWCPLPHHKPRSILVPAANVGVKSALEVTLRLVLPATLSWVGCDFLEAVPPGTLGSTCEAEIDCSLIATELQHTMENQDRNRGPLTWPLRFFFFLIEPTTVCEFCSAQQLSSINLYSIHSSPSS
jgi:hypothetical protein